jgi:hypothetical protein
VPKSVALFLQRTDVGNQRFYVGIRQLVFITFHLALAVLDDVRRFGVTEALVFAVVFQTELFPIVVLPLPSLPWQEAQC